MPLILALLLTLPAAAQSDLEVLDREAAALSVSLSSAALSAAKGPATSVSVRAFTGSGARGSAWAPVAAHLVRGHLLRLGLPVVLEEGQAEFELRGSVDEFGEEVTLSAALWRRADGRLAGTALQELAPWRSPEAKPGAPRQPGQGRGGQGQGGPGSRGIWGRLFR